jgi:hypothetical protein
MTAAELGRRMPERELRLHAADMEETPELDEMAVHFLKVIAVLLNGIGASALVGLERLTESQLFPWASKPFAAGELPPGQVAAAEALAGGPDKAETAVIPWGGWKTLD